MQFKTSCCNKTLLKKDLTRFAPLWGVYTLGLLMLLFLTWDDKSIPFNNIYAFRTLLPNVALYNGVYALAVAAMLFGDLYNTRMCYGTHALPMTRGCWFGTHILSGLLFSLNYLNGWFVELLGLMGYTDPAAGSFEEAVAQLPSLAGGGFVGVLVVVALLPAVLEETLFRGIILDGIKDIGTVAACLLGGLLFCVFHQNPSQTLYQFICGCAFTLLALRADSLLPAVLCHFLNNAVIVCNYKFAFLQNVPSSVAVALYVISGVCLAGSLVYLIFFDKKTNRRKEGEIKPFFLAALVGFILCCVLWVYTLVVNIAG